MSQVEKNRVEAMLYWLLKAPRSPKNLEKRREYLASYTLFLRRGADSFEAMVIRTLLTL